MTRANFYDKLKRMGVMSVNEIRQLEDMDPIDGGNEYGETAAPAGGTPNAVVVRTEAAETDAATLKVNDEYLNTAMELFRDDIGSRIDAGLGKLQRGQDGLATGVGQTVEGIADLKRGQRDTATAIDQGNEQQQAASAGLAYMLEDHHRQTQTALAGNTSKLDELTDNHDWYSESVQEAAACVAGAQAADLAKHAKHADSDRERFNAWVTDYFAGKAGQYMADKFERFVPAAEVKAAASELAAVVVGSANPAKLAETWKTDCAAVLVEHFTKGKINE